MSLSFSKQEISMSDSLMQGSHAVLGIAQEGMHEFLYKSFVFSGHTHQCLDIKPGFGIRCSCWHGMRGIPAHDCF